MPKEKAEYRLTEKQKRFADEYLIDCNGTRAYKAAYPNCKKDSSADANARKLLGNARIREYIDEKHMEKTLKSWTKCTLRKRRMRRRF